MKHILSFSGGHDSTALLLFCIKHNLPLDSVVFADTTLEFPLMYVHVEKVKKFVKSKGIKFETVYPKQSFEQWFYGNFTKGNKKGRMRGFPLQYGKGCHLRGHFKWSPLSKITHRKGVICYLGINYDEKWRKEESNYDDSYKFPLIDNKIGEVEVLKIVTESGFFNPLYRHFKRTGCWLCPQQRIDSLRNIWKLFPDKWEYLKKLEKDSPHGFRNDFKLIDLEERFKNENIQTTN